MIIKSYDIQKKPSSFLGYNLLLLYGENDGLKKDIKESIRIVVKQKNSDVEFLTLYENDINDNEENFYNCIYSGSLFSSKKIITINDGTDKIIKQIKDVSDKCPTNVFIIILSDVLEKKSKLRNFFELNTKTLCVPCYPDNDRDLEIIAKLELKKHDIILSKESINLLIEKSNFSRNSLKNEIVKIQSYALYKKKIMTEEIKSIINFSGDYKSDLLINECLCGNVLKYKKIFSEMYVTTINQIFLLRILSNKVQRLLNMKKNESKFNNLDSLLNSTKPPIFWKEKPAVKKQLSIWKMNDLNSAINEINDIELMCKKYPQISKSIFFNFFSKICKKASNYS